MLSAEYSDTTPTLASLRNRLVFLCEAEATPYTAPAMITLKRWSAAGLLRKTSEGNYIVNEALKLCRAKKAVQLKNRSSVNDRLLPDIDLAKPHVSEALGQGAVTDLVRAADRLLEASSQNARQMERLLEELEKLNRRTTELEAASKDLVGVKHRLMSKYDEAHTLLQREVDRLRGGNQSSGAAPGGDLYIEMRRMAIMISRISDRLGPPQ